jgi:hypothetical protein
MQYFVLFIGKFLRQNLGPLSKGQKLVCFVILIPMCAWPAMFVYVENKRCYVGRLLISYVAEGCIKAETRQCSGLTIFIQKGHERRPRTLYFKNRKFLALERF